MTAAVRLRVALAAFVCGGTGSGSAQAVQRSELPDASALTAAVDAYFAPIVANHDFAGAVLIARGDDVFVDRAYGEADAELGVASSTSGRYRIASVTKTFTAAAILMLAERDKVQLDDPLSRFLPGFPRGDEITVLQLLRHESGLGNPNYAESFRDRVDLVELVRRIAARPRLFEPGADSRYSNAGYNVLARVIEVASGESYDEFLQRNIFEPLGMIETGNWGDDVFVPARVRGFLPGPPPAGLIPAPWSDAGFLTGAGSVVSTTHDLLRWARAVHAEQLFRRSELPYPYGWGRLGEDRKAGIEQTGLGNGFTSSLSIWFQDSLYVVILGNIESARWGQWSADLATLARGGQVAPTPIRQEIPLSATLAERFVGEYATDEHTIEIDFRNGSLWLYLDGYPVPKYLAPVGPGEFELRSDFGRIVFEAAGQGPVTRLAWVFGPDNQTVFPSRSRGDQPHPREK